MCRGWSGCTLRHKAVAKRLPAGAPPLRNLFLISYVLLMLLTAKGAFLIDERIGIVFFFILLLPLFCMLKWPDQPFLLYVGFSAMLIGKFVYAVSSTPLKGPDENNYYAQVQSYLGLGDFLSYASEHISTYLFNSSAYPIFGLMYMPFYKLLNVSDPLVIITYNSILLIWIAYMLYALNKAYFGFELVNRRLYEGWIILGLFLSPSFMMMSSLFAKDVTCVALGLYCTYLLMSRKYFWFLIVMLYATGLRDYAIVYTLCFYLLFTRRFKIALSMLLVSAGVLAVKIGGLGLVNAFLLTAFLFMSPNPINLENWEPHVFYRSLEAVSMLVALVLAVLMYIRYKETRRFYLFCLVLLFAYACTLVLVGYMTVTGRNLDYGLGTIGDNMVRKKLPILPLLYMFQAYTACYTVKWLATIRNKRRGRHERPRPVSQIQGGAGHRHPHPSSLPEAGA
ncbi:hypothetical protein [Paenibacillus sp. FJAT-26967]|uniref:hypothetical protein n=1 Tax=Paenibacillus sp. FJAT-26967 TaxID=1729690 RepID=UPI0020A3C73A|nr:hypothetical protein [Paenibacillus sp. FJAT-26967]